MKRSIASVPLWALLSMLSDENRIMILGPQPQLTNRPAPLIGGQPVQTSPQVASFVGQPLQPSAAPNPISGVNLSTLQNLLAQGGQNANPQPNTPSQTFNGMTTAGATPAQALQVAQAPNGATDDYAAGYGTPAGQVASPGGLSSLIGALSSMFGSGSGGGGS